MIAIINASCHHGTNAYIRKRDLPTVSRTVSSSNKIGRGRKKGGGVSNTFHVPIPRFFKLVYCHVARGCSAANAPIVWVAALCTTDCTCKERFVNLLTASVGSYRRKNAARPPGEPNVAAELEPADADEIPSPALLPDLSCFHYVCSVRTEAQIKNDGSGYHEAGKRSFFLSLLFFALLFFFLFVVSLFFLLN